MNYKISIIVPVFNVENYIRESLESIVTQTIGLENLEVIMVNDCSTDKSGKIIDEYSAKYTNFIALHLTENSGAAGKPRNVGMTQATGKYLMFLDSDDNYNPNACKTLYNRIEKENVDIVFSRYQYLYQNRTSKCHNILGNIEEISVKTIDEDPRLLTIPPSVWTKIFRREFIVKKSIDFPESVAGQDLVFVIHAFMEAKGIIYLNNQILFNYNRIRDAKGDKSVSRNKNMKNLMGMIYSYRKAFDILKKYDKEEYMDLTFKIHLEFWLEGFILSKTSPDEKIELITTISPLFEAFGNIKEIEKKYLAVLFKQISEKRYEDALLFAEGLKELILRNENEKRHLKRKLRIKNKKLNQILPINGYLKYKTNNLVIRIKSRLKRYKIIKIALKYFKSILKSLETYQALLNYNKMTFILPYRRTDDPDREINLDITLKYLNKVGIKNIIISEHSDESAEILLMTNYALLFKSFKVIHANSNGSLFNKSKSINNGVIASNTEYVVILDIDCITKKKNINKSLCLLQKGYEVVHPFNRSVKDIENKEEFKKNYDFSTVKTPKQKRPWADGGIVFWNKKSFVQIGMKNEYFSGWGGEDNEIMVRADLFNLKQYRINDTLYHLYHKRPQVRTKNNAELMRKIKEIKDSSVLQDEISNWHWVIKAKNKFSY